MHPIISTELANEHRASLLGQAARDRRARTALRDIAAGLGRTGSVRRLHRATVTPLSPTTTATEASEFAKAS